MIALLLAASIAAGSPDLAEWNPPTEFDRPFNGQIMVKNVHPSLVAGLCNDLAARAGFTWRSTTKMRGCAWRSKKRFCEVIMIDRPMYGTTPKAVLRHERGHCNGWAH